MPGRVGNRGEPLLVGRLGRRAAAVLAGGLLGSGLRVSISAALPVPPGAFPFGTLLLNLLGSALLGLFVARRQRATLGGMGVRFFAIGLLGAMTTFSTFALEVVELIDSHHGQTAAAYVAASVGGGLLSAVAGLRIGRFG